jgi:hypothetical protein
MTKKNAPAVMPRHDRGAPEPKRKAGLGQGDEGRRDGGIVTAGGEDGRVEADVVFRRGREPEVALTGGGTDSAGTGDDERGDFRDVGVGVVGAVVITVLDSEGDGLGVDQARGGRDLDTALEDFEVRAAADAERA